MTSPAAVSSPAPSSLSSPPSAAQRPTRWRKGRRVVRRETCAFSIHRPVSRIRASITRSRRPDRAAYIAGQQGRDIDNKIVGAPGDFRAQAEQAFLNIKGALGAAGGGFEHVVKLCHYFIDLQAHFRMMRDIRLKYFDPARMPASTMIQVGALTDEKALYEIDVVAVLPPA
jgi:enamine deaminase RidA (YjgF/YER057c/UK114 family)